MKIPVQTSSCIAAALCWALLSALTGFIIWGMRDRARLIRDNDNERILNMLFTSLREYDDFGSAIESNPVLTERIAGSAVYGTDLTLLYYWGKVPPVFDEGFLDTMPKNRFGRYTIPDRKGHSIKFVLHTERMGIPPPASRQDGEYPWGAESGTRRHTPMMRRQDFFFNALVWGKYIYIDISHPAYWRTQTFTALLFPLSCLAFLALVVYIRGLYIRNGEYRDRIEAQKNLVVLGTAASTLAHEIKNPLLSIRLQTGILRKLFPDNGKEEVAIIDEEVERLSALTYRVNDYLRDAEGNRVPLNTYNILAETSRRLCGRNILRDDALGDGMIFMDPDRLRSVLENILRNALESGGPEEAISATITRTGAGSRGGSGIVISIFDRGTGIAEADMKRIFDPFFTSKSTGTGIGLSISKRFVEAVKGSVILENREGGGTVVRITLVPL
ncbi:MAG: HAMP domain-containing histidine kinase [Treponema sp.]|jgi:two-component system sensor histidine kinase HydH|nr:HAMP domain-containing histidine kinase [Treponema sp.]